MNRAAVPVRQAAAFSVSSGEKRRFSSVIPAINASVAADPTSKSYTLAMALAEGSALLERAKLS